MRLILGLGNPGKEYANTRHNLGFLVLDQLAEDLGCRFGKDSLFDFCKFRDTVLIKPSTYMNLSGRALKEAMMRWKAEEVLTVYDDLELPPAELRIRTGGGDGGHNGVKSLIECIPPADLKRIRIGIGRNQDDSSRDYVLSDIEVGEQELFSQSIQLACKLLKTYIKADFRTMLDEYSKHKKSYSGAKTTGILSPKEEQSD